VIVTDAFSPRCVQPFGVFPDDDVIDRARLEMERSIDPRKCDDRTKVREQIQSASQHAAQKSGFGAVGQSNLGEADGALQCGVCGADDLQIFLGERQSSSKVRCCPTGYLNELVGE
jgi:hypothetical protein